MKRSRYLRRAVAAAGAVTATLALAVPPASGGTPARDTTEAPHTSAIPPEPNLCPTERPTLYDVTIGNRNVADFATDGHVWALTDYLQHVQVWRIGEKHYCFRIEYDGTWTSFAGVSPGGTGTISEGLTGTVHAVRFIRLTGEFNPQYPLSGHVADFDWQCGADGTCTGPRPSPGMYFSPITNFNILWDDYLATSATNGYWRQTLAGDFGDITD